MYMNMPSRMMIFVDTHACTCQLTPRLRSSKAPSVAHAVFKAGHFHKEHAEQLYGPGRI